MGGERDGSDQPMMNVRMRAVEERGAGKNVSARSTGRFALYIAPLQWIVCFPFPPTYPGLSGAMPITVEYG